MMSVLFFCRAGGKTVSPCTLWSTAFELYRLRRCISQLVYNFVNFQFSDIHRVGFENFIWEMHKRGFMDNLHCVIDNP